jgi:hypothetical protein
MSAFAAAKRAAQQRGIKEAAAEKSRSRIRVSPGVVTLIIFLLLLGGGATWLFWPKPPRYLQFPATAEEAAKTLLTHISAGTDPEYLKAYALIADSARNPKSNDEQGDYTQVFHAMNLYLSGEFGSDWPAQTKLAADPADTTVIVAKVSLETLRIHVQQQTPADKMSQYGPHFGITGVDDFPPQDAADMRQMAGIEGILRGVAGEGAVRNLQTILGAGAGNRHQPRMVKKMGLLAVNRDPRKATSRSVLQMYPLREDPVVRARLLSISQDDRYDPDVRERAKLIVDNRVPEEDLIAAGVE